MENITVTSRTDYVVMVPLEYNGTAPFIVAVCDTPEDAVMVACVLIKSPPHGNYWVRIDAVHVS